MTEGIRLGDVNEEGFYRFVGRNEDWEDLVYVKAKDGQLVGVVSGRTDEIELSNPSLRDSEVMKIEDPQEYAEWLRGQARFIDSILGS